MTANDYCIIQTESLEELASLLRGVEDGIKYLLARVTGEGKDDIVEFEFMEGITNISSGSFYGFKNLALTSLPEGITSIGDRAFYDCTNLALTSLPEGITGIGRNAFSGCLNLALTSLPNSYVELGAGAFSNCPNLALTSLPDWMTYIPYNIFGGCRSLALTSLPDTLTEIDGYALSGCTSITSLTFKSTPKIAGNAFSGSTNLLDIYVPWSEGEVSGAPWGATNATIHYNSEV